MIVSPGNGLIFVHIPKTGGTSMALALEAIAKPGDIHIGDTPHAKALRKQQLHLKGRGRLWKHSTLADIDGLVGPADLDALVCFTLVRNPWDRAVSYYHWLRAQDFDHAAVTLAKALPFAAFLTHPHTSESLRAWPARRYMTDAAGQERCDLYARLEHLEEDLAPLVDGLGQPLTIPRANASRRARDYRSFYDDTLAAHLGEICAEDIARFGYGFG